MKNRGPASVSTEELLVGVEEFFQPAQNGAYLRSLHPAGSTFDAV
jgi:hypothetical protein